MTTELDMRLAAALKVSRWQHRAIGRHGASPEQNSQRPQRTIGLVVVTDAEYANKFRELL